MQSHSTLDENLQKKKLTSWLNYQSQLKFYVLALIENLHQFESFLSYDEKARKDFLNDVQGLSVMLNSISKVIDIKSTNKGGLLSRIHVIEGCLKDLSKKFEMLTKKNNSDINIEIPKAQINELEKFLKKLNVYIFDYDMYSEVQSEIESLLETQIKPTTPRNCCTPFHTLNSKKGTLQQPDCTIL